MKVESAVPLITHNSILITFIWVSAVVLLLGIVVSLTCTVGMLLSKWAVCSMQRAVEKSEIRNQKAVGSREIRGMKTRHMQMSYTFEV